MVNLGIVIYLQNGGQVWLDQVRVNGGTSGCQIEHLCKNNINIWLKCKTLTRLQITDLRVGSIVGST